MDTQRDNQIPEEVLSWTYPLLLCPCRGSIEPPVGRKKEEAAIVTKLCSISPQPSAPFQIQSHIKMQTSHGWVRVSPALWWSEWERGGCPHPPWFLWLQESILCPVPHIDLCDAHIIITALHVDFFPLFQLCSFFFHSPLICSASPSFSVCLSVCLCFSVHTLNDDGGRIVWPKQKKVSIAAGQYRLLHS